MHLIHKEIKTTSGTLAVYHTQMQGKPTLICLHGGPGLNHKSLLPGLLELTNLFDLVLLDLPGEGNSTPPSDGKYSLDQYVDAVATAAQTFKGSYPLGLFGHSFGGHVAMQTLAAYPDLFNFGILCTTFVKSSDWFDYLSNTATDMKNPVQEDVESKYTQSHKNNDDFKTLCMDYAPLYFPEIPDDQAKRIMNEWTYHSDSYNYAAENILPYIDMTNTCKRIPVECLVIGAELDKIVSAQEVSQFEKLIENTKSKIIENAGHFPFLTARHSFGNIVNAWWSEMIRGTL